MGCEQAFPEQYFEYYITYKMQIKQTIFIFTLKRILKGTSS